LPEGQGPFPQHNTMERCSTRAELGVTDPHGIKGFSIHDVEVTAPVHQYFGVPCVADDGVDNEQISAWLRDTI
jgi:hypothetical protein